MSECPVSEVRPILACLGGSADSDFPLLLVVGREYNGTGGVEPYVGHYCFTESPRSTFWNRAYGLVERACQKRGSELKRRVIAANLSPIAFSNALPNPIENEVADKRSLRLAIPEDRVRNHVATLFSLPIAERFKVVILSVGDGEEFRGAREAIEAECKRRDLYLVEIPYLGNQSLSSEKVDDALSKEDEGAICSVVGAFPGLSD